MTNRDDTPARKASDRHRMAVLRSLQHADESAARGDHRDALAWLRTVETVDGTLPVAYERKRSAWLEDATALTTGVRTTSFA